MKKIGFLFAYLVMLNMTKNEEKEVIRVCGPNYEESDIPAFIRKRDENKARAEDAMEEELRETGQTALKVE
jgi:tRNA nucleotidyltransferase (CCA-adding enzyme)